MMKIETVNEMYKGLTEIYLTTSLSFAELIAMDERGCFFRVQDGKLPFSQMPEFKKIRRNGETICEGKDLAAAFCRYLEAQTGRVLEMKSDNTLRVCLDLFLQVRDQLDAEHFEIIFKVRTNHAETDSYDEVEKSELYKRLRHMILVEGKKQIQICGNAGNRSEVRKTVIHLVNELGNLAYASDRRRGREIIALHSGYNYENFMEKVVKMQVQEDTRKGLRDTTDLVRIDGVFKEFCNEAAQQCNVKNPTLLPNIFVMENYGEVSPEKLFGEALYSMAPEYRKDGIRIRTMYQTYKWFNNTDNHILTDHFDKGFYIPENVVIIGFSGKNAENTVPVISTILPN